MRLETSYSTLVWSADGALVTKTRLPTADWRARYRNELRVNQLIGREPPPVATPRLASADTQRRSLTFEAVSGDPLGPKYPTALDGDAIDVMIGIASRLRLYEPRRRWFRRLNSVRRLGLAHRVGLLDDAATRQLIDVARCHHATLAFAHGDLTARNVLGKGDAATVIDWEWAGLYPPGYDRAFLWFSLIDVEGGRARVEVDEPAFFLSALLIQLWHLQWFLPPPFREKHLATRDELVARLLG